MLLSRSFLMQIPFIQNINTYIFADKISPDLAMELYRHFRPSPLHFQVQDLSSCALFLCLVSWEGSQVSGWYLPPSRFWFTLQMILAHNIDRNVAPRTCLGIVETGVNSQQTCQLSLQWLPCMNRTGASLQTKMSLLSKPWLTPCFPRGSAFLCRMHSRI